MRHRLTRPALVLAATAIAAVVAVPVFGQELSPSPSDEPSASASASTSAEPSASEAGSAEPTVEITAAPTAAPATSAPASAAPSSPQPRPTAAAGDEDKDEAEGPPVLLVGRVGAQADAKHPHYTLTVGTTVYELETGPWWFWGDTHPLAQYVGKTVTIQGQREGTTSLEVFVAGGTTIRQPGKPPWAGGPKVVGERHPGWKPWKADKWADGKPGNGPKASAETTTP